MTDDASIDPALQSLPAAARKVAQRAYAPYSNFRVGAALRLSNVAFAELLPHAFEANLK